jgi:hypothetical protein
MSSTTLYNIAEKVCLSKGDKSNIHIAKYILYGKSAAATADAKTAMMIFG